MAVITALSGARSSSDKIKETILDEFEESIINGQDEMVMCALLDKLISVQADYGFEIDFSLYLCMAIDDNKTVLSAKLLEVIPKKQLEEVFV